MNSSYKKLVIGIIAVLVCFNVLAWAAVLKTSDQSLKVVFFDVGQGDSIFIETPKGTQVLIDGGPNSKVLEKLNEQLPFFDRSLDLVILTHPDADHLAGLVEVLKSYKADFVAWTGVGSSRPEFQEFLAEINQGNAQKLFLAEGEKIIIGKDVYFEVLAPLENFQGREVSDFNSSSLILKMVYGKSTFLFTGDSPQSIEWQLVDSGKDISSQVLKVSHHGSDTATSDIFLQKVDPEIAVISAGAKNRYGHPAAEILERLEKYGIKTMRTDQQGNIKIFSNGEEITVNTEK